MTTLEPERCLAHAEEIAGRCVPCAEQAAEDQLRADALAKVDAACDERFPLRFRSARTEHPTVLAWVAEFHTDPQACPSLLLLGPTGTGKTFQAYAALRLAVARVRPLRAGGGYRSPSWQATTFADFCAAMRPRPRADTEQAMKAFRSADLLMVDDLGAAKASEWVEESTYRLLNGRYEDMRPSILTSNLSLTELREAVGDRIASRLSETATRVVLDGPDRRRKVVAA